MIQRRKRFLIVALIVLAVPAILIGIELATGVGRAALSMSRAKSRLDDNNPAEAIGFCDEAIALRPDWAPPYNLRASANARLGKWDLAIADGRRACELSPRQLDFRRNLAANLASRGSWRCAQRDFDAALADHEEALKLYPESPVIPNELAITLAERGVARVEAGDFDRAIADLRRSLEVRPRVERDAGHDRRVRLSYAFMQRGKVRLERDNLNGAVEDFAEGLKYDPASEACRDFAAIALVRRGKDAARKGNGDLAILDCDHAIELFPDVPKAEPKPPEPVSALPVGILASFASVRCDEPSPLAHAYCLRGTVRLGQNELDEAAADFTRAISQANWCAEAYEGLGLVRLRQNDDKESERLFAICRKLRPGCDAELNAKIAEIRKKQ
jgi:tetratricopeptide (TPR) repeat protein